MGMAKSRIGYTNDKVPWYYNFNPSGFGCSGGCEGCWARKLGKRMSCPDCKAFKVHIHPERLDWPAKTKKPGVVLVNFTCDTFDPARSRSQISQICSAMASAPQHQYVMLTQQAQVAQVEFGGDAFPAGWPENWHLGLTIRNQAEAIERLGPFLQIPGKLWLSLEPLWKPAWLHQALTPERMEQWPADTNADALVVSENYPSIYTRTKVIKEAPRIKGVIVGHDNRRGAPGTDTLIHIRSVVEQCKAAGVACYVKQIWYHKPEWDELFFLRASHPDEYALYPADLKHRDLPWAEWKGAVAAAEGTKENVRDGIRTSTLE